MSLSGAQSRRNSTGYKSTPFNIEGYCILPGKKNSQFRVRLLWNLKLVDTTVQDCIGFL